MNYDEIKQLAAEQGIRVSDLCALAPKNDPFYVGRPAEVTAAGWFAHLWGEFGYGRGVHLRRVHYQIVSNEIYRPDGSRYENTETCWDFLNEAAKWARYLKLVDPEAFVDRRNPEAVLFALYPQPDEWNYYDPTPGIAAINPWAEATMNLPDLPDLPELPFLPDDPTYEVSGYVEVPQAYHVELWVEKSTMNDVLLPLCRRYHLNLVTGAGELSITAVVDFVRRARQAGRPARILYISDFDPAGLGMPISVARKIEFFQRNEGYDDLDIRLHPIVLTPHQIDQYNLPRVPVKNSDLRKTNFEAAYGVGQVELDALEALYPGQLNQIVRQAILQYYDPDLQSAAYDQQGRLNSKLSDTAEAIRDDYQDILGSLNNDYEFLLNEFEATRAEFSQLVAGFQPKIERHREQLESIFTALQQTRAEMFDEMLDASREVDLDDFSLPEPELPDEPDSLLYDSSRDYMEQLDAYKAQRSNGNGQYATSF